MKAASQSALEGGDWVSVTFFGDGASNEGAFHGSLNLASIWKLPVIFVCENNGWAVSVPATYALSVEDVSARAAAYNIPGIMVDGSDGLAVYEAAEQAVLRARTGQGPTLIECKTHRWRLHAEQRGNPADPRPRDVVERGQQHDPLRLFGSGLQSQGVATANQLEQIESDVQQAVEDAVEFAKSSPLPRPEDALSDVFAP